jgi:hypothetical protein
VSFYPFSKLLAKLGTQQLGGPDDSGKGVDEPLALALQVDYLTGEQTV